MGVGRALERHRFEWSAARRTAWWRRPYPANRSRPSAGPDDTAARRDRLQRRNLDTLGIDADRDQPAMPREPVDRRHHCLGARNGGDDGARAVGPAGCCRHVLGCDGDKVVRAEPARERIPVGGARDRHRAACWRTARRDGGDPRFPGSPQHRPAMVERIEGRDPGAGKRGVSATASLSGIGTSA